MVALLTACTNESPVAAADTIAEDSALAAQVLAARGDEFKYGPVVEEVRADTTTPPDALPPPPPQPERTIVQMGPSVVMANPQRRPVPQSPGPSVVATNPAVAEPSPAPDPERAEPEREREAELERERQPARTGIISSGAPLLLVIENPVCDSSIEPGRSFRARLSNSLRGSNGAAIPGGAQATAEVISASKWGAGISVRVKSIRFQGRSYPVNSRATDIQPEGRGGNTCIPDGTRIDVRTTESLRIPVN